jgi:ATP-dependent Clp protease ATP-binding subunit ClpA
LLSAGERAVLRRLAVFVGGFTLEAAEAVCAGDPVQAHEALDLLLRLVDKSLVVAEAHGEAARYRLLETIHRYAEERLLEAGEAAGVGTRHRDHYLGVVERVYPELFGSAQPAAMAELRREEENVDAALRWSVERGETEAALRIGGVVSLLWASHHPTEGRRRLETLLTMPGAAEPTMPRARALDGGARIAFALVDPPGVRAFATESAAIYRQLGDRIGLARSLRYVGLAAMFAEDYERAEALSQALDRAIVELDSARAEPARWPAVDASDIAEVVARTTGIPVARLTEVDRHRLLHLEDLLRERVVGQDEAVEAVADAVRAGRAGLTHPDRPVGSFLFLGPTGVGKTELARALAGALFGTPDQMIRFDMSEFQDRHTVSRLVGAPPGYVGHDEPGQLTEAVRRTPYAVLLLDEIEKAHPDVTGMLLQVLDAGRLTDARGRTANFANTVIIMTSNVGAEALLRAELVDDVREPLMASVRARFRPEFLNRIDEIVLFRGLGRPQLRAITELLLAETRERLRAQGVGLRLDTSAVDWLAARGHRPDSGARPLRRTIGRELDRRLSRMLLGGELRAGQRVEATAVDDHLELTVTGPD